MGVFIVIVAVLLACVLVSRMASNDLREAAIAIEILFSFAVAGAAISLPISIMCNTKVANKHQVLKEMRQSSNKSYEYLLTSDVLYVNYAIMKHRSYADNFWIGIWYDKDIAKLELLK